MKIAIEAQRIFRKEKHGMDVAALQIIKNLQIIDKINDYYIIVRRDSDRVLSETENFHIIELPAVPYPIWEQYYLPRAVKKLRPDILHCTSNTAPLSHTVPVILTLHDIIYLNKQNVFKGSLYQKLGNIYRRFIVPRIVDSCRSIITVSDFQRQRLCSFFSFDDMKVQTIYNAYDTERYFVINNQAAVDFCRKKYSIPEDFIFYLGNTDPRKNLSNVIKAFSYLISECGFETPLVIGGITRSYLISVLKKLGALNLVTRIYLTGYIADEDLPILYSMAKVFLFPSLEEGFGIPIIEAMACGTPVITSNCSAMPEIGGNAALFIDPHNYKDIGDAIIDVLSNPEKYKSMQQDGLLWASRFSWINSAREILSLYEWMFLNSSGTTYKGIGV